MILTGEKLRVWLATRPVDFRKGHDGLSAVAQTVQGHDLYSGAVFAFRSKRGDRMKILVWEALPRSDMATLPASAGISGNGSGRSPERFVEADANNPTKRLQERRDRWCDRSEGVPPEGVVRVDRAGLSLDPPDARRDQVLRVP